jgi:hypothetical protein
VNDVVRCAITVKNNAFYDISAPIVDTLSACFEYVGNPNTPSPKVTNLTGGRTLLEWSIDETKINGRSEKTVSFDVRVLRIPPCN